MAIIAISGKIGSGKDTIGRIIQCLLYFENNSKLEYFTKEENIKTLIQFVENNSNVTYLEDNFHIKKWADALKEMLCIIIGIKREQLEDSNFKNTELGEEWWYWKLYREGGYDLILLPYNTPRENLAIYEGLILIKPTPRLLLQQMGTECGRNIIHPNIWVNALMSKYKEVKPPKGSTFDYTHTECIDCKKRFNGYKRQFICNDCYDTHNWYPNWIITDTRFPNELQAVKDKGGISIRVNRPNPKGIKYEIENQHESETALDKATFDYTIDNNSTLEELVEQVRVILIKEKILCPAN